MGRRLNGLFSLWFLFFTSESGNMKKHGGGWFCFSFFFSFFVACDVIPSGGSFWVAAHSSEYKIMFAKEEPCPPFF